jgi:methylmalonyl-CoA mutase
MRQARAQFSCNFLACAGYEVVDNLGFDTVEEGVEAAMKAKADIVVLCSSDDEYAEYAIPAFKALNGRAIFISCRCSCLHGRFESCRNRKLSMYV